MGVEGKILIKEVLKEVHLTRLSLVWGAMLMCEFQVEVSNKIGLFQRCMHALRYKSV